MNYKFPLAVSTWDDQEISAMQSVISSGFFSMGAAVKEYERTFASYFGSKFAVMSNSGSSANLLMVAALFYIKENPLHRGDEVIVPAVSWSTTYFPLQQYGLKLVFVDIDLDTLNYDLAALSQSITEKTKLIFSVNLLGNSNDYSEINNIIGNKPIHLIEDNCESMDAEFGTQKCGTFGIAGSFSSYFSHHISTMEGGMTVTNSEEIYHIMLSLRSHGWTRHLPDINYVTGTKSSNSFAESFNFVLPGYNLRPLELSGAIGLKQLDKLPSFTKIRRQNADYFVNKMSDSPFLLQKEIGRSSWFGFSLILKDEYGFSREKVISKLHNMGIETRPIVSGNFVNNPVMKYIDHRLSGELKNAEYLHRNGLFVGNSHEPLFDMIDTLSQAEF